jgi:hypothetical protein
MNVIQKKLITNKDIHGYRKASSKRYRANFIVWIMVIPMCSNGIFKLDILKFLIAKISRWMVIVLIFLSFSLLKNINSKIVQLVINNGYDFSQKTFLSLLVTSREIRLYYEV